jgi:hypothetical protein
MEKEKFTSEIRIAAPPSLYNKFLEKCKKRYKTVSEVLRELMVEYIERDKENE